ncbi:glycoside hydrolase family 43 protein [Pedobacter sp.]|uniref:glycoside hydrolase family 43 protein n=1 Tax=Pedobacter sp. TaxID=1411316 RepID=UPI003D7F4E5A
MMKRNPFSLLLLMLLVIDLPAFSQAKKPVFSGNPLFPGWYADPEAIIFDDTFWIYPTFSENYGKPARLSKLTPEQKELQKNTINPQYLRQTFLDAFSSKDLIKWKKHPRVLDVENIKWAAYSIWAPSITRKDNKYYLFFGANDIQNDQQLGGIGVAVSDKPQGPFKDHLGKPLISKFHNKAQPIDQFVFKDKDGQYYLIYGGWKHCNIAKLNDDFSDFIPFDDGETFKSITPEHYVEGPFMFIRNDKYYLMWSEGGWMGPNYSVAYSIGDSPLGPFKRIGKVLEQDPTIAKGAGHHSVFNLPGTDEWYIVYHRRPLTTTVGYHRETSIERMYFDEDGKILPVKITNEGVERRVIGKVGKP